MKKLPKSISILGKRFVIKRCEMSNYGEWDDLKKEIKISTDLIKFVDQVQTLYHEVIEIVSDELGWITVRRYGEDLYILTHKDIDILASVFNEIITTAEY